MRVCPDHWDVSFCPQCAVTEELFALLSPIVKESNQTTHVLFCMDSDSVAKVCNKAIKSEIIAGGLADGIVVAVTRGWGTIEIQLT